MPDHTAPPEPNDPEYVAWWLAGALDSHAGAVVWIPWPVIKWARAHGIPSLPDETDHAWCVRLRAAVERSDEPSP